MISKLKSADDFGPKRRLAWGAIRHLLPARTRWFIEGNPHLRGQLWYSERKMIYAAVRCHRPESCFEIGTWRGGGSTLFITQALYENKRGILHTIEVDSALQHAAKSLYEKYLPELLPFVEFHLGDYRREFISHLEKMERVDFLFLDGAEDAVQTLVQYGFFEPWLKPGSLLLVHDWLTEKTRLLRPEIENSGKWAQQRVLLPPVSVGMVLLERRA